PALPRVSFTFLRSARRRKRNAHERVPVGCTTKCRPGHAASGYSARTASPALLCLGLAASTKRVVSTFTAIAVTPFSRGSRVDKTAKRACTALLFWAFSTPWQSLASPITMRVFAPGMGEKTRGLSPPTTAAVHVDRVRGHKGARIRAHEQHQFGDFLRLPEPLHRHVIEKTLHQF